MCGIVAYIGKKDCKDILLKGLERLEYRGYDSAGIGLLVKEENGGAGKNITCKIKIVKVAGKISSLKDKLKNIKIESTAGIGHTRWATHGEPNKSNAHPHLDCSKKIAVVHNGIIENFSELKKELKARGHDFTSDTDTEVIPHLLEEYLKERPNGSLVSAMQELLKKIRGSGAIVAIYSGNPHEIVAGRIASPLIAGLSGDGNFFASDMPAVLEYTRNFIVINDDEAARITEDDIKIYNPGGRELKRKPFKASWDLRGAEKSGYETFMLKEIFEQPRAIKETMRERIAGRRLDFDELDLDVKQLKSLKKIQIIACGTSYHAALTGKLVIEKWAKLPVEVDIGSEYRYRDSIIDKDCLFIAISQSGETIDTLAAIKEARSKNAKVLAITNVVGSTISRESDSVIYTRAGPEIGVCATKTFTAQLAVMYLIGLYLAKARGFLNGDKLKRYTEELGTIPGKISKILKNIDGIRSVADRTSGHQCFLFLGRVYGYPMALEGALKLKEISYIHAEGFAAGEMKHGPIALADKRTVVIGVIPKDFVHEKMLSNLQEVKARNASIFSIITEGDRETASYSNFVFEVPETLQEFYGILTIVPLQLYAYYIARNHNRNVDQPRNLAKSVTVE